MKRSVLIALLLTLLQSFVIQGFAQEPSLVIPQTMDIGEVKQTQIVEHPLIIENTGNTDLKISSISSDCPCTSFKVLANDAYHPLTSDKSFNLSPGEKLELKLIFDSNKTNYIGAFKKFVIIHSNDPQNPIARIRLVGTLIKS